jgi:D-galactarolactone cycloisomerase
MVDANHCYTTSDAFFVGRALVELGAYWFEEPVAPEDLDGYRELRSGLKVNISGGEAEFNRGGWRQILENRGLDIAQPEVCALGGVSEYLRVLALCHAHFTPVINHVWGSAVAVATNIQLLAAMPALPGGHYPWEPKLEFDTTDNRFRDNLLELPLDIQGQVKSSGGFVSVPTGPGLGVTPDMDFIRHYELDL